VRDSPIPASPGSLEEVTHFVPALRPEDIPEPARARAALHGAGSGLPATRMLFDGRSVSLAGTVFAAATQIDKLDGHDSYGPTKGHLGVVAVPTLAALVIGYEIAGRAVVSGVRRIVPTLGGGSGAIRG